jgi:hypothetical protein
LESNKIKKHQINAPGHPHQTAFRSPLHLIKFAVPGKLVLRLSAWLLTQGDGEMMLLVMAGS